MTNQPHHTTESDATALDDMLYLLNCYDVWSATPGRCGDDEDGEPQHDEDLAAGF